MSEETKPVEPEVKKVEDTTPEDKTKDAEIAAEHEGLKKLSTDELISIIAETRGEAKTRRLKTRELEDILKKQEDEKKLNEQVQLEKNQEWEKAYGTLKDETKDYTELKEFKQSYLEGCKDKVENIAKGLVKAEQELFEISSKNMSYNEQLTFLEKLVQNRAVKNVVDTTHSMGRTDGKDIKETKDKPNLFGNPGGVMAQVMNTLKQNRQQT